MPTLLRVSASPGGEKSISRQIGGLLVENILHIYKAKIIERDLAASPPPYPDHAFVDASLKPPQEQDEKDRKNLVFSECLIAELASSKILVIDTPMYNFTVPAVLKTWIDNVVRPERTFQSSLEGKIGLLNDRPAFLVVASGGPLSNSASSKQDFLVPYVRHILQTIGIKDFRFICLDGLNRGEGAVEKAQHAARAWISQQSHDLAKGLVR